MTEKKLIGYLPVYELDAEDINLMRFGNDAEKKEFLSKHGDGVFVEPGKRDDSTSLQVTDRDASFSSMYMWSFKSIGHTIVPVPEAQIVEKVVEVKGADGVPIQDVLRLVAVAREPGMLAVATNQTKKED